MPRIDPLDLLKCLGVLLSPTGGIKGQVEVERVARLMLRFSKKLVSKCIYIHVLKATPVELLDAFVSKSSSWFLLLSWLTDALQTHNTPLLVEMLELLLLCPMTDERLKDREITTLIQSKVNRNDLEQCIQYIAQQYNDQNCRNLATQLWSRWFVKPSDPNQFTMSQDPILPDDIDLSIYAPDASANFGDSLNLNMGDEVHGISNLSTLDMTSYAPFMENNDYYNVNHVEPVVPMNNNMDNQAYMSGGVSYVNEPIQQQHQQEQQLHLHQQHQVLNQSVEMNTLKMEEASNNQWNNGNTVPVVEHVALSAPPMQPIATAVTMPVLKIKVSKLGQQYVVNNEEVNRQVPTAVPTADQADGSSKLKDANTKEKVSKDKKKEKKSSGSGSSSSSSSKTKSEESSKKSSSSDSKKREKEREKSKSSSKDASSKSSSSSSSKDKSKNKESDAKSKSKSSSRSESQSKEQEKAQQTQKNLQTLATIKAMTPAVKLAKIPRKKPEENAGDAVTAATAATAAASAATDFLDKLTPRPKTVKTFNSKFRSTGLVDETGKGSPPVNKKLLNAPPTSLDKKLSPNVKRPGTTEGLTPPVEKKLKPIDDTAITAAVAAVMKKTATDTKPAVKLISPRPRPFMCLSSFQEEKKTRLAWRSEDTPLPLLQDSSLFMDALEAGSKATTEPRKRKRSSSSAKDTATPGEPAAAAVTVKTEPGLPSDATSPQQVKPMFKFYQDTLETDEVVKEEKSIDTSAENKENKDQDEQSPSAAKEEARTPEPEEETSLDSAKVDGLVDESSQSQPSDGKPKGVLVIHSQMKRRVKKSVQWKTEDELEMHHFFELDETERVNVNKLLFGEMKQAEREREKEAVKMSKNYIEEPEVEENPWKGMVLIDIPEDRMITGENSKEREIQEARENSTLQALYFKGQILPDSPAEPDTEVPLERTDTAPVVIPLDDVTGNPESVYDHRHLPWPEPKLPPPYGAPHHNVYPQPNQPPHMQQPYQPPHQPPHMQQPFQPQQQQQFAPPFRNAGPMDQPFMDRGIHDDHLGPRDIPHHQEQPMLQQHHNRHIPQARGPWNDGPIDDGPRGGVGDHGGTWMTGDGSVYPDERDQPPHFNDSGPAFRDGPHHRDNFHLRDREHPPRRDRGFNDVMDRPGQRFMGPPRGMGMDGPRPRFHGPPRGGSRPGGPDRWGPRGGGGGGGNPANQTCWHYMRGFCRLESNCKFMHTN